AAMRSVLPVRAKWTTSARPSTAVTRPTPSSGLKRWVRKSPSVHLPAGSVTSRHRISVHRRQKVRMDNKCINRRSSRAHILAAGAVLLACAVVSAQNRDERKIEQAIGRPIGSLIRPNEPSRTVIQSEFPPERVSPPAVRCPFEGRRSLNDDR